MSMAPFVIRLSRRGFLNGRVVRATLKRPMLAKHYSSNSFRRLWGPILVAESRERDCVLVAESRERDCVDPSQSFST